MYLLTLNFQVIVFQVKPEPLQQAYNIIEVDMVSRKKKQTHNRPDYRHLYVSNEAYQFDKQNRHMSWLK